MFMSDLSVSDSVGYCRGSDFLMDVNYLQYLWDARQAISTSHRSVRLVLEDIKTTLIDFDYCVYTGKLLFHDF